MRSTLRTALLLGAMACALDACSLAPRETRAVYEPVTDATAAATPMAQLPPAAGEVVGVLQSRVSGVFTQRIVLAGDRDSGGENTIVVMVDANERRPGDFSLAVPRPTQTLIAAELEGQFPGVDMRLSTLWNRNAFGPFGYAIGKAPQGVTCLFAWQYAPGRAPGLVMDAAADSRAASMPEAPTSVRVRLCRAHAGESEMVAWIRALQVFPPGSSAPYVDPAFEGAGPLGAGDALTAAGAPGPFFLAPPAAAEPVAHRRAKPARRRPPPEISSEPMMSPPPPLAGVVNVPLPGQAAAAPAANAAAAAANPLLAPLKSVAQARALPSPPPDDMPLPGRLSSGSAQAAPTSAANPAGYPPIPLPN